MSCFPYPVQIRCSEELCVSNLGKTLSLFTFMHWRRKWQPTPVFLPGESQGWGSLVGCRLWGREESDTTEATKQQQPLAITFLFSSYHSFYCYLIFSWIFVCCVLFVYFYFVFTNWNLSSVRTGSYCISRCKLSLTQCLAQTLFPINDCLLNK